MHLDVRPADPRRPDFVGEVIGRIDLRRAEDRIVPAVVAAMDRYGVLVFHDQPFGDDEQIAFSQRFGELGTSVAVTNPEHRPRFDKRLSDISNIDADNRIVPTDDRPWMAALANRLWHTDASFKATIASYSMLSARIIPSSGGETEFADLRAAYDALPARTKARIGNLQALHATAFSREKVGFGDYTPEERATHAPRPQPLVRVHPGSGRTTLYLAAHAGEIAGMTVPEGRMLLADLTEHATQREFVHRHSWRQHDFVIWDNRCTMHRGRDFDRNEVRDMRRTTVNDGPA